MDQTQAIKMRKQAAENLLQTVEAHEFGIGTGLKQVYRPIPNDAEWWLLVSKLEN